MKIDPKFAAEHFAHSRWASTQLVEAARSLTPHDLERDLGSSFGGVLGTLIHMFNADRMWLSRLMGNPRTSLADANEHFTLDELQAAWDSVHAGYQEWCSAQTGDALEKDLQFRSAVRQGEQLELKLGQAVLHIVNHATYHRGQITTMLRQLGVSAPGTDYSFYCFDRDHPATRL